MKVVILLIIAVLTFLGVLFSENKVFAGFCGAIAAVLSLLWPEEIENNIPTNVSYVVESEENVLISEEYMAEGENNEPEVEKNISENKENGSENENNELKDVEDNSDNIETKAESEETEAEVLDNNKGGDITNKYEVEGNITYEKQSIKYKFVPPVSGLYRFDISELRDNAKVYINIYNELNEIVKEKRVGNDEGVTVSGMNAGEKYTIEVEQWDGKSNYSMKIGYQNPTIDVSGVQIIIGAISYVDQVNVYEFVPPVSGLYRFDMSELYDNAKVVICVYNRLNETVKKGTVGNGEGITVEEMNAGEKYTVEVEQWSGISSYNVIVGYQNPEVDISNTQSISGNISYLDQENNYMFIPLNNGTYKFEVSELQDGATVKVKFFNRLHEKIKERVVENGESIEVENINAGEQYMIKVMQWHGKSDYILKYELSEE